MRPRKPTLMLILFIFSNFPIGTIVGNPIPIDYENEASPTPYNSRNYNNSVYFSKENIIFTFDSSNVYVEAYYTFKNSGIDPINLSILLPFYNNPENLKIVEEVIQINYGWEDIKLSHLDLYPASFKAAKFSLDFSGEEEKTIKVTYHREYMISKGGFSGEKYYSYIYIVGTARAWNQPIGYANFTFRIPKTICHEHNFDSYRYSSFYTTKTHYTVSIVYFSWTPSNDELGISWSTNNLLDNPLFYLMLLIIGIPVSIFIGIIMILRIRRRSKR